MGFGMGTQSQDGLCSGMQAGSRVEWGFLSTGWCRVSIAARTELNVSSLGLCSSSMSSITLLMSYANDLDL